MKFLLAFWACIVLAVSTESFGRETQIIDIGVLAFRSPDATRSRWKATADHLSDTIDGYRFEIIAMNYPEMNSAVENQSVEFILTNTGHYVELEVNHGIARLVTLVKSVDDRPVKVFGGVIFTRSDRSDIHALSDIRDKRFLAVKKSSLGGFLVAWEQFEDAGIDPFSDFSSLDFNGMPHDGVVQKVLSGEADAGTVRTSVIEHMIKEGLIQPDAVKIINPKTTQGFPYVHSTRLYPEWPFARLPHAGDELVEKVTLALLNIPKDSSAAQTGRYNRWTPPLDYREVHAMFKKLKAGPYEGIHSFTLRDVMDKYIVQIFIILGVFVLIVIMLTKFIQLNQSLKKALSEVKALQGFLPICSSCKKIRDDQGYWNQIESYISEHSDTRFSHGICPECTKKIYGKELWYNDLEKGS